MRENRLRHATIVIECLSISNTGLATQIVEDYSHFGSNRCNLFEQAEIDRWNAAVGVAARGACQGRSTLSQALHSDWRSCHQSLCALTDCAKDSGLSYVPVES
jgi:hypothetical protein